MNFVPSAHQAAGHDGCMTSGAVFAKQLSPQEIEFYAETNKRLLSAGQDVFLGSQLGHWMPTFMGTMAEGFQNVSGATIINPDNVNPSDLESVHEGKPYVVLLNLYHQFLHPCILDIKLGSVLTDDTVTPEKRARLAAVSKATTSGSLAFRICGMKIYGADSDMPALFPTMKDTMQTEQGYTSFDKHFGRLLDAGNVEQAISLFFKADLPCRKHLLTRFHQRLALVYNCLLDTEVRIKSGSLLFIYEGDPARWTGLDEHTYFEADPLVRDPLDASDNESDSESDSDSVASNIAQRQLPLSSMNIIDFAHAKYTDGKGPDDNIIDGVENLVNIFERLAASA